MASSPPDRRPRAATNGAAAGLAALAVVLLLALPVSAGAVVPFRDIVSGGPLTHVSIGNELSCQVAHTGDPVLELFPSGATPGSCGTIVSAGGALYAPDFANHAGSATSSLGTYTPFTPVSQSAVTGSGSSASPFKVTTVVTVGGTGLRITQIDSYVAGQESYRTDVTVQNTGGGPVSGFIYRAGDCFLQGTDVGFGFVDTARAAAGCSQNANNTPAGRIEQWFPITGGNQYLETSYSQGWGAIATQTALPNTCQCTTSIDNWAGLSWSYNLAAGGSATFSHYTTFSPTGVAGPPPAGSGPVTAFGPNGLVVAPSNRRCISRRHFRIRLRQRGGIRIEQAVVFVNGRRVAVRRGRRVTAAVDLRGLPKGRYRVRITIITTTGRIITGTRRYRTCAKRHRHKSTGPA
jgi:hypothetical protein